MRINKRLIRKSPAHRTFLIATAIRKHKFCVLPPEDFDNEIVEQLQEIINRQFTPELWK